MTVARILAAKGGDVVIVQPHRSIADAARVLAEKHIGAVVVAGADRKPLGILSERDIVRALAQHGAGALNEAVTRYMTGKIVSTTRYATLHGLMETMTNGRFRHLPVLEDGALVGIISIGDVVKNHVEEIETESQALREYIATT